MLIASEKVKQLAALHVVRRWSNKVNRRRVQAGENCKFISDCKLTPCKRGLSLMLYY